MTLNLFFMLAITQAAPAPEFLAINYEKSLCMRFWAGDEFHSNPFPKGRWERYMAYGEVKTKVGSCTFKSQKEDFKKCCEKLGLKFVSPEEATKSQN